MATSSRTTGDFGLPGGIGAAVHDLERGMRSAVDGLTADTGSAQAGATPLTAAVNVIGTVGTAGDSALLPAAKKGAVVLVKNASATSADVFPASGEKIDGGSADAAKAVAGGKATAFFCAKDGEWHTLVGA